MEHKVFESLKEGNKTLQALHNEMSVEAVEDLMAETADAIAYQNVFYMFIYLFCFYLCFWLFGVNC